MEKSAEQNKKQIVPTASAILEDGTIAEMVFLPELRRSAFSIYNAGRWTLQDGIDLGSDARLIPFSPNNNLIKNGKGMWWLYFRRAGKLVGVAIIEAPTLYHARTRVAVRGIGKAMDYSDAKKLDDEDAALVPPDCIGKLLLAEEAQQLSDRICAARADGALRLVEHGD
jgi:hypothetical protein